MMKRVALVMGILSLSIAALASVEDAPTIPKEFSISCTLYGSGQHAVSGNFIRSGHGKLSGALDVDVPVTTFAPPGTPAEMYHAKVSGHFIKANPGQIAQFDLGEDDFQGEFPRLMQMQFRIGEDPSKVRSAITVDQTYSSVYCSLN